MKKPRSFYLESLGCAKNQVDSELMIASLEAAGWRCAALPEEADAVIVNTCGFISDAKKESIETALSFKSRFPRKKIYMVGCLSERYPETLAADMPEMDGLMGNADPAAVVRLLEGGQGRAPASSGACEARERTKLLSFAGSAYVKVAEGCSNRCTYCAIPLIRGDLRSRARADIVAEIRGLLSRGIREIVLIAQDLGSYGEDRGERDLPGLLESISGLAGDFWVRLLYVHPDHFPRDILPVMARDPRLLPYFDIPFQHASPDILSAMGRVGDPGKNLDLIGAVRSALPGAVIRSTLLVGFPGETEEDFGLLLEFQKKAALDWMGVFAYSREEDTPAHGMRGTVPRRTAKERKRMLEEGQAAITERALDGHVGRVLDVLVEEPVEGGDLCIGRAYLQAPDVDGLTVVRASRPAGSVVRVRITRRNGLDLEGDPLDG